MQFGGRYGFGSISVRIRCICETALKHYAEIVLGILTDPKYETRRKNLMRIIQYMDLIVRKPGFAGFKLDPDNREK